MLGDLRVISVHRDLRAVKVCVSLSIFGLLACLQVKFEGSALKVPSVHGLKLDAIPFAEFDLFLQFQSGIIFNSPEILLCRQRKWIVSLFLRRRHDLIV